MKVRQLIVALAALFCIASTESTSLFQPDCANCKIYTPNAFSPNNDGINDEFRPLPGAECIITDFLLKVFDRNGALVFQTDDQSRGWDGKFRSQPAPIATYYYVFSYTLASEGGDDKEIETGDVSLIR